MEKEKVKKYIDKRAAKSYELALKREYFRFLVGRKIVFKLSRVIVLPFFKLNSCLN